MRIEPDSPTWRAVKVEIARLRSNALAELQTVGLDAVSTERVRGILLGYSHIAGLADSDEDPAPGPAPY